MQWIQLILWMGLTLWAGQKKRRCRFFSYVICSGILFSMGTQLWILWGEGKLSLETAVPLHLCSMTGLLTLPMLLCFRFVPACSKSLFAFSTLLGAPCALMALCFPAIMETGHPMLMASAFFRLHVLILCAPLLLRGQGFALPTDPQGVMLFANFYLLGVTVFNRFFHTNYLFLYRPPYGTPLAFLAAQGSTVYALSLEMGALLLVTGLAALYGHLSSRRLSSSA